MTNTEYIQELEGKVWIQHGIPVLKDEAGNTSQGQDTENLERLHKDSR